jgi:NADPH:quinone reductase
MVGSGYVARALVLGVPGERINTVVDFKAGQANGVKTLGTKQAGGMPVLGELAELAAAGALVIPITAVYPLGRIQEAYRRVANRSTHGKVVLKPLRENGS